MKSSLICCVYWTYRPKYTLELWHLLVALVLSLRRRRVGAHLWHHVGYALKRLVAPLENRPILRNTGAGFLLGAARYGAAPDDVPGVLKDWKS